MFTHSVKNNLCGSKSTKWLKLSFYRRSMLGFGYNQQYSLDAKENGNAKTVSEQEMRQFRKYSDEWWRPGGPYDSLQKMNNLRVPMIKKLCGKDKSDSPNPLSGFKILDVGSGGGILSEPLARLGGNVLGIDPLEENIEVSMLHAERSKNIDLKTLSYECTNIETLSVEKPNSFDVVIASEVLEHVNNPELFIKSCCNSVKPGGHILVTTINRTILSTVLVKYVAEYILKILPENTHDENKFVTPYELIDMLRKANMEQIDFRGMSYNPITNVWSWSTSNSMNYACHAQKPIQ